MFQDLDKNKYIHPFHQTNRGHLIIAGDQQFKNDYILGYILRRLPNQYNEKRSEDYHAFFIDWRVILPC